LNFKKIIIKINASASKFMKKTWVVTPVSKNSHQNNWKGSKYKSCTELRKL